MTDSKFVHWRRANPTAYDELLRRRREKYQSDLDAREKQLAANAAWRSKQKRLEQKQQRKRKLPRAKVLYLNGAPVEFWSIGRAASYLNVSKQTITNLEQLGTIPINHYVCPSSRHRWWPARFVQWLRPFFDVRFPEAGQGISAQEFHRRVWTSWGEEQVKGVIQVVATSAVNEDPNEQSSIKGSET